MDNFVNWVASTELSAWILDKIWVWPTLETLHFFGLCLLLGGLLVIDLRLVGLFRRLDIVATHKLLPFVFAGFGINLVTGVLFYIGDPGRYSINIAFQLKMLLVLLAGLNALLFFWKINPVYASWGPHGNTPALAKAVGGASLLFWFGVLIFGRMIPYMGTG